MRSISDKDMRTLRMGAIGGGLIVLYVLVLTPALDHWDRLNKELTDGRKKLQAIQTGLEERVASEKALRELRQKAVVHEDARLLTGQTPAMLQQVEALPGYSSITVRRLEGLQIRDETEYHRSAVSLQFSGSLRNVHRLLLGMEKAQPALKVERLSITSNRDTPSLVEGQMVIAGYGVVLAKGKRG